MATVAVRPRGLSPGWIAAAAGLLALVLGLEPAEQLRSVLALTWDPSLALVGIILLARAMDAAGCFRAAALAVARAAGASRLRLLLALVFLTGATSALFSNDAAVLVMTPLVVELTDLLDLEVREALPYWVAVGLVADTASLPLPISNLVNIMVADRVRLAFAAWAAAMVPCWLASLAATAAGLALFYRPALRTPLPQPQLPSPGAAARDIGLVRAAPAFLVALLLALLLTPKLKVPTSLPVLAVGAAYLLAFARRQRSSPWALVRRAPWDVLLFAGGMFLVVDAALRAGRIGQFATHALARFAGPEGVLTVGAMAALASSAVNNLPATLAGLLVLPRGAPHLALALAAGADVGPKLTPFGSLATLIWWAAVAEKGYPLPARAYLVPALALVPVALAASLAALAF